MQQFDIILHYHIQTEITMHYSLLKMSIEQCRLQKKRHHNTMTESTIRKFYK